MEWEYKCETKKRSINANLKWNTVNSLASTDVISDVLSQNLHVINHS